MSLNTNGNPVKYGLIKRSGTATGPNGASIVANNKGRAAASVFSGADKEEDKDEIKDIMRKSLYSSGGIRGSGTNSGNKFLDSALVEDPNIFDYDGAYDSMKKEKEELVNAKFKSLEPQSQEPPKARYISNLMKASQVREIEKERIYEKKLLKERQLEDDQFSDQPKFITTSYKKKLLDDKKWEYEDKLSEEIEKRHDVRSLGMQGFYSNLLTKNVAMGSNVEANAISAYTAGSARQAHVVSDPTNVAKESAKSQVLLDELPEPPSSRPVEHSGAVSMDREKVIERNESKETNNIKIAVAPSISDKVEVVLSARERYLARKRNLESMEEKDTST